MSQDIGLRRIGVRSRRRDWIYLRLSIIMLQLRYKGIYRGMLICVKQRLRLRGWGDRDKLLINLSDWYYVKRHEYRIQLIGIVVGEHIC